MFNSNIIRVNKVINEQGDDMQQMERRALIIEALSQSEDVDVEQLAMELQVSSMTIRRDLKALEAEGKVIRTHGSAVLKQSLINESAFKEKETKNNDEKRKIAEEAIKLVREHTTLLLDSGTTTLEIAKLLKEKRNITVITNDIQIAAELLDSQLTVMMTGGILQRKIGALAGSITEEFLNGIHVDLLFLGAHAIDFDAGVTAPAYDKAYVKKRMITASERTWLVADASKINQKSFTRVCHLEELDGFITDRRLGEQEVEALKEHVKVRIV